jgi:DNA invertase Pin-like site-specific DNA recombinase
VSTTKQHDENQLYDLREWAGRRALDVKQEFATEDSAWARNSNGAKGKEFDKARAELLDGARLGHYTVVLIWDLSRLSRRGIEDTLRVLRVLAEYGCTVWSYRQSWVEELTGPMREVFISFDAWKNEMESDDKSDRIKAGIARRKREGKPMPGGKAGRKMPKGHGAVSGAAGWEGEKGEARREALRQRNRDRGAARQQAEGTATETEAGQ